MIRCEELIVRRGGRRILDSVTLDLTDRKHWLVWGGNGAGKTTLARALAGLIEPDGGRVIRDPSLETPLPMLFQDPDAQIAAATVRDEIALGVRNPGEHMISRKEPGPAGERLAAALSGFQLDRLAWRHPHALSGGEKRRLNLAALTVLESPVLFLDEPELFLDPQAWRDWSARLASWLAGDNRFLLEISRLPERVIAAEGLIVLDRGALLAAGDPEEVYRRGREAGLPIPTIGKWEKVNLAGVEFSESGNGVNHDEMEFTGEIGDGAAAESHSPKARGGDRSTGGGTRSGVRGPAGRDLILAARDLVLNRPAGGTPILDSLNLELGRGEKILITGGNGSGKTSLLLLLADLADPDGGEVWRRQGLTSVMVFQSPERSCFAETVQDEIEFGPLRSGLRGGELGDRVLRAMTDLGLPPADFARRDPFTLSAGELRRVALASMLAMDVELLIMDEPASALDGDGSDALMEALSRWPGSLIWADCRRPAGGERVFTRVRELHGGGDI